MPIGRFSANAPWMQKVDPVSAFGTGARLGTEQAKAQTSLMAQQQAMQQQAEAFPLEQRARNLTSQKMMLDMAMVSEQREARLDALELGNQATAQNLVLRREEAGLAQQDAGLRMDKGVLDMERTRQDMAQQSDTMKKEAMYQSQRPILNDYTTELQQQVAENKSSPEGVLDVPASLKGRARAEALKLRAEAQKSLTGSLLGKLQQQQQSHDLVLLQSGWDGSDETKGLAQRGLVESQLKKIATKHKLSPEQLKEALTPAGFVFDELGNYSKETGEPYLGWLIKNNKLDVTHADVLAGQKAEKIATAAVVKHEGLELVSVTSADGKITEKWIPVPSAIDKTKFLEAVATNYENSDIDGDEAKRLKAARADAMKIHAAFSSQKIGRLIEEGRLEEGDTVWNTTTENFVVVGDKGAVTAAADQAQAGTGQVLSGYEVSPEQQAAMDQAATDQEASDIRAAQGQAAKDKEKKLQEIWAGTEGWGGL